MNKDLRQPSLLEHVETIATDNTGSPAKSELKFYTKKEWDNLEITSITFNEATDLIVTRWISVKDKLPDENQEVLTCSSGGGRATTVFITNPITKKPMFVLMPCYESLIDDTPIYYLKNVTHWMPLPEPPEEK